jgi:hypothetical protein
MENVLSCVIALVTYYRSSFIKSQYIMSSNDFALLILAEYGKSTTERRYQRRRACAAYFVLYTYLKSIRPRYYLTTSCLDDPSKSVWHRLYEVGSDAELISVVAFDRATFEEILASFRRFYIVKSGPGKPGRPPKLPAIHCVLALLLHFYTGTMEMKSICEIFNIPPSTCSRIITNAEIVLRIALRQINSAAVRWPSFEEQRTWAMSMTSREPLIHNKFGFVDGKNYRVQEPSDRNSQNSFYNGWLHSVFITGTFCFGVDGTIIWGRHNSPGSWNDGETSRELREILLNPAMTLQNYGIVADSAFPVSNAMHNRIVTPLKKGDLERAPARCRPAMMALSNAITSVRQAAEWGVGSMEKPFRRLLMPFPLDPEIRKRRIINICKLSNLRVRRLGISQIRNTFSGS